MPHTIIETNHAPQAIGTYSQAVKAGNTVYLSGQIPLDPKNMQVIAGDFTAQATQAFENLRAVVVAAGGQMKNVVKLTIYLTDLSYFSQVNEVMAKFFQKPYPARAALGVAQLPKDVAIEIEGVMVL